MFKHFKYGLLCVLGAWIWVLLSSPLMPFATKTHALESSVEIAQAGAPASSFVQADQLYRAGRVSEAEQLYRQLKPEFSGGPATQLVNPIFEPEALSSQNLAYWNAAQTAIANGQSSGAIGVLEDLIASEPGFLLAPLQLADVLKEEDRGGDALNVLEQAATLHPSSPDIVMAHVNALANDGQHLEASIAARSFAILYLDNPMAGQFRDRAQSELDTFLNNQRNQNLVETGLSIGIGILTGNASVDNTYERISRIFLDESALGADLAAQYREQFRQNGMLVEDPELVDYVTQLGLGVAQLMGRDFDYEFHVIRDPSINAFALPGGKIFVNTGAIMAAKSEAELAGLMGHEVAHAVLSHGMQRISKNDILSQLGDQIPYGDILSNLVSLEYSRQHERQSDILGTRALAASGYAADGLRNFMATLNAVSQSNQIEYLSSHPAPASRVDYLEELIQQNGYNRYALEGVDRHQVIQARAAQFNS